MSALEQYLSTVKPTAPVLPKSSTDTYLSKSSVSAPAPKAQVGSGKFTIQVPSKSDTPLTTFSAPQIAQSSAPEAGVDINPVTIAKEVVQSVPRAIISTGKTVAPGILERLGLKTQAKQIRDIGDISPEEDFGKFGKIVFGERPIKDIRGTGEETIKGFGGSEEIAKKYGMPIGILSTVLDLLPPTKELSVLKNLAVAKDVGVVGRILKDLKISEEEANRIIPLLVKADKPETVKAILETVKNPAKELQDAAGVAGRSTTIAPEVKDAAEASARAGEIRTQFIDRFSPIYDLTKGKNLTAESDPYVAARLYAGHSGQVQNRLSELSTTFQKAGPDLGAVRDYALYERYEELAGRGIENFPGGKTIDQLRSEKRALEESLGPERLAKVKELSKELNNYSNKLLTEMKDAGIISQQSYDAIIKANERYVPLQRAAYVAEQADNIPRGSNVFSVAKQDLIKAIEGSTKEIVDPLESIVRNTYRTVSLIARNKVAQLVGDLSKLDEFKGIVIPLNTAEQTEAKFGILKTLKDTFKENRAALSELSKVKKEESITQRTLEKVSFGGESFNRSVSGLESKLRATQKEADQLFELAVSSSVDLESNAGIQRLISKAETRERQLYKLSAEMSSKIKAIQESKVAPKAEQLRDIKVLRSTIEGLISQRKAAINELRSQLTVLRPKEVPAGMEKISVLRRGIKEEYAVPKNVGEALKGMNTEAVDMVTKWASKSAAALRAGATSFNLAFLPSNIIRDFQTATIVSKVGFTPIDWVKGFAEAINRGEDYKRFLESGASYSGYFESQKGVSKTVQALAESKGKRIIKTIANPLELIRFAGEQTELAPRLGVFKRSLAKGFSETEAAFNARNATVDFAKAGSTMKVANMWVPFLNARLQGTVNMFAKIGKDPLSSSLKLSAIVGAPVIATYLHNTRNHSDIWNDIAQFEKDNNFIIIYGDGRDAEGNPTQVIKIPKGDAKIFSTPLENFIAYMDKTAHDTFGSMLLKVFSAISPVGFEQDGQFAPQQLIGGVLPPTIKAGVESVTNKNLYTGRDIVPRKLQGASPEQQYTETTSPIAKKIGQLFNISPLKIQNAVGTQFGGLGRQILDPLNYGTTVAGRFVGAAGGALERKEIDNIDSFLRSQTDVRVQQSRDAEATYAYLKSLSGDEAATKFDEIIQKDPTMAKNINQLIEDESLGLTFADRLVKQLGVANEQRAQYIVTKLQGLEDDTARAQIFDEYVNKKIITSDVADQIQSILNADEDRPQYESGEETSQRGLIDTVSLYARALGTDPITAFNRIFTGQRILKLANDAIVVERLPLSESSKIRRDLGATTEMRLDHTVPLQLGGSNTKSNLKLVPVEAWRSYTPVENYLGQLLRAKKITRKQAQETITKFKNGELGAGQVLQMF
jgi:hypothetical protein